MKAILAIFLGSVISISLQSSDWLYSKNYPWIWDQNIGWYYMSGSPEMIWSNTETDWILNPHKTNPFDVDEILRRADSMISIRLNKESEAYAQIFYNTAWDGKIYFMAEPPSGWVQFGDQVKNIKYILSTDRVNGTGTIFIRGDFGHASVILNFKTENSGSYLMMGSLGSNESIFPAYPDLGYLEGSFSIQTEDSPTIE